MDKRLVPSLQVPEVALPSIHRNRREDIQGLRAIAVLTVVAFHAGLPIPGGFVGVDMFFVISGFVITAMLQAEWAATGRINFRRFYARRFKRLIPALALVVTCTLAASVFLLSPFGTQQVVAKTAIGSMLFMANAAIARTTGGYFDAPAESNPLLHVWSLSVEEQFYLVFPLVLMLCWWLGRRSLRVPVLIVACVAIASLALAILGSASIQVSWLLGFYSPLTRAWEFALGAILVLSAPWLGLASKNVSTALGLSGIALLGISLWFISRTTPFPGIWTLLPVLGTVLLILAGSFRGNAVTAGLSGRPLVVVGDWSYSIYLWHWPLIVFANIIWSGNPLATVTAAALSIVPAVGSYLWIEQPIRNTQGYSAYRFAVLVVATLSLPMLCAVGLWQAARTLFWHQAPATMNAMDTMPTGWGDPLCISRIPVNKRDTTQCQWAKEAPGRPIYLVGDSNAMHFSEAARNAASALGRPVTALATDGCPLIDAFFWRKSDPPLMAECRESYAAMMDWLTGRPPGLVVIGAADRYWRDADDYRVTVDGNDRDADPGHNADILNDGLQRTVVRLQAAGHSVALLQAIPSYVFAPYAMGSSCNGLSVLRGACRLVSTMPVKAADQWQLASREGIRSVARKTGATVFDFRDYFCADEQCATSIHAVNHYMSDGYHLNKTGSAQITERFTAAIESVGSASPQVERGR